jgi:hypothetical protein
MIFPAPAGSARGFSSAKGSIQKSQHEITNPEPFENVTPPENPRRISVFQLGNNKQLPGVDLLDQHLMLHRFNADAF